MSFARPPVLVRPPNPFVFLFGFGEQTTLSFARPPVLVRPSNPFDFFSGFGEQTTLSFARPPVLVRPFKPTCFFVWVKPWSPTFFLLVVATLTNLIFPPFSDLLYPTSKVPKILLIRQLLLLKSEQQKVSMSEPFCVFVRVWRANDIVVCSPACPRPTTEPFRYIFRVRRANDIVVCSPACPRPTTKPFRIFFGFGEQTTMSFARPPVLVRPRTLLIFRSGLASKRHCRLLACLSSSDHQTFCFFVLGQALVAVVFLLVVATLTNLLLPPFLRPFVSYFKGPKDPVDSAAAASEERTAKGKHE